MIRMFLGGDDDDVEVIVIIVKRMKRNLTHIIITVIFPDSK